MNAIDNNYLDLPTRTGDTSSATEKYPAKAGKAGSFSNEGFGFCFYIVCISYSSALLAVLLAMSCRDSSSIPIAIPCFNPRATAI